jgi:hypothetical protein
MHPPSHFLRISRFFSKNNGLAAFPENPTPLPSKIVTRLSDDSGSFGPGFSARQQAKGQQTHRQPKIDQRFHSPYLRYQQKMQGITS